MCDCFNTLIMCNISIINKKIISILSANFTNIQAIYLFGSYGTENQSFNSDLDIAVLFDAETAKRADFWLLLNTADKIAKTIQIAKVDLINIRCVNTVFKKEIIMADKRIYCANQYAADEFEMLTLSYYQKLNEERKEILQSFFKTKRVYNI
jgi:predicted nucleotidyltransferase